jgi:hypothetical protein
MSRCLITRRLRNIQPQSRAIQINLILAPLQHLRNISRVCKFSETHVAAALLDGVTDQLCGAGFSLCAHDNSLFLLSRFIDYEGGALGFLLRYLFCFDGSGEFRGEGEMLSLGLDGDGGLMGNG